MKPVEHLGSRKGEYMEDKINELETYNKKIFEIFTGT
jgi:hypothetical protein